MFVFLSKFLPLLVYPLALSWMLIFIVVILRGRPRFKKGILIAVLALLFIFSNSWVANSLQRAVEQQYLPPASLSPADAIVVLGGGTESAAPPRTSVEVNGAGDRVIAGVRLYREAAAPYVVLSGGNITWVSSRPSTPASEMAELMEFMGVPADALVLQGESQNTHEDAVYSAELLKERQAKTIILVTSALHMPRSVALFEKQGFEVIPYPVDYGVTDYEWNDLWHGDFGARLLNLIPSVGNLSTSTGVMKELIGRWVYGLQGWL